MTDQGVQFAGESAEYRDARRVLLQEERQLRLQLEHVAQLRRQLPPGRSVDQGYRFEGWRDGGPAAVPFEDLFALPDRSLVIYSYMFEGDGPPCPMCTAFLDSLDGVARQLSETVNLAVVAKASARVLDAWRASRGWSWLALYSEAGCGYSTDYFGEAPDGNRCAQAVARRRIPLRCRCVRARLLNSALQVSGRTS
jgi:predicted dithiol-disulfide oxidoreductase (DUF899 family)